MDYKKSIIILILAIFLFSITSVCASDVNDTVMAGEDTSQMILSAGNEIDVDNLKTGEENNILVQTGNEPVGAGTDSEILGEDIGNYSGLSEEIKKGRGSIELEHKYYKYDNGPTIEITESMTIEGKGAVIDMGGSNIRVFNVTASGVTINNLTIKNVNCEAEGGAFYSETGGIVTNCNFINNSAGFTGGAISFKNVTGSVANCNFIENSAAQGSAVCFWDVAGNVTNCTFTDNSAASAGALYLCGGIVSGCTFTGNSNFGRGGAIASFTNVANIVNCTFTNNYGAQGGAIAFYDADCNVTGCTFIGNTAIIGTDGGAIWTGGGNVTNCTFVNNTAESAGGAISFYDYCIVTDCTFLNNDASGYGGAISLNDGIVTNCNFINNSGEIWGGAIGSGYVSVNNCTFTGNTISGDVKNMGGHAIYSNSGGSVTNCVFVDNSAESIKYAIYSAGALYDSLDNNWWGSNDPDWDELISYDQIPSSYAVLDVTAEPDEIRAGGKSDIITKFIWNGTDTDATNLLPKRYILLSSEGNLTQTEGDVGLTSAFYANDEDKYVVNAEVDNEKLKVKVKVTGLASPTNITVNVTSLNLTIGETSSINATLTPADAGNLTYTSSNSSIAVVENGKIKAIAAGTAVVTVSFPGNENYTAAENKTINVTVNLKDAIISVNNSTLNLFVGDNFTVVATTTPAGLKVTFVQDDSGVYIVDENGNVTALKEGTGHILVKVGGDGVYAENTTEITVSVSKIPTEITLTNTTLYLKVNEIVYGLANLTPADAGNLTFISSDENIVFVTDGAILARSKGNANVTVSFAGNDKYAAALNRTIYVNVSLKDASVSVENSTLELKVDERYDLNATAVPSFLNVEYVSSNESVATVTDYGIVTAVGEGTTTITLTVGNDVTYAVNTTNVTVTVSKIPTEITVDTTPLDLFVGDEIVIVANLTPAGAGNVTFTSSDYDVVDFDFEGNIIAQGKGQAIITVSFAGDDKYAAAENKTIIINVSLDNASVTVDNNTLDLKVGETSAINATKHPDTIMLDITYTSSNNSVVTVDKNGIVTAVGEGTAVITVEVGDDEIYAKNSTTVNVTVSKVSTEIESSAVTTVYNVDKNLIVTLKDANGNPIRGANITVDLNGEKTYTTDEKGQVSVSTKGLAPKAYTAKITFNGNSTHDKSNKDVKVTVKKATPKITAKAKTFKTTTKTKKYSIVLKNNVNKPIKKATVYLKVNGKTYKATTNSKGKATFKITKLNKAGKFKATVTYKGNKYYNKVTKKVTIKVKSVWKTVSKGSKNSAIVKKIQRALKNHGYYLEYNGRYLMVDGIYWDYTEMAVKEFQNDKVLKVTGKVDEKTAKKLGIIK